MLCLFLTDGSKSYINLGTEFNEILNINSTDATQYRVIAKLQTSSSLKGNITAELDYSTRMGNLTAGSGKIIINCGFSGSSMYALSLVGSNAYIRLTKSTTDTYTFYVELVSIQGGSRVLVGDLHFKTYCNSNWTVTNGNLAEQTDTVEVLHTSSNSIVAVA